MTKYSFDEEGVAFYFFIATLVGFYLIPATISLLWPKKNSSDDKEPGSKAPEAKEKKRLLQMMEGAKRTKQIPKNLLLAVLWVIFGWALYSAWQVKVNFKPYDPFEILGIPSSANEDEIRTKFKRMSRIHHPDKAPEGEREEAQKKFVEISNAYKALTDEKIRKNWEDYGNPDGVRTFALGVALPAWLVEASNRSLVLALYCLAFGLGLPLLVKRWWSSSKIFTKDGLRHASMALFFRELKENSSMKRIIEMISNANEFQEDLLHRTTDAKVLHSFLTILEGYVEPNGEHYERLKKPSFPNATKAHALLYAYFHRIPVNDSQLKKDQAFVVAKAAHLVQGVLQIAMARQWLHPALNCMTLSQYLVQACWEKKSILLQLPHITEEISKHASSGRKQIHSISDLLDMSESDRKSLLRSLSSEEYNDIISVAQTFPEVHVEGVSFKILGQEKITPGGLITCQVRLSLDYPKFGSDDAASDDRGKEKESGNKDEEVETFEFDEDGNLLEEISSKKLGSDNILPRPIYCPHFPAVKRPCYWVGLVNRNNTNFITPPVKVTDFVDRKTVTLQLPAPPKPMSVSILLIVKSDSVIGTDLTKEVKFTVYPPSEHTHQQESWEISGDEEGNNDAPFGSSDDE